MADTRFVTVSSALGCFSFLQRNDQPIDVRWVGIMAVSAKDVDAWWKGNVMSPSYQRRYDALLAKHRPDLQRGLT